MPFLSLRSSRWMRMRGSMSSRLLLAVEPRAPAPRREALLKLWLVPEQERHKGGS